MFLNHMLMQLFTEFPAVNIAYCLPVVEDGDLAHTHTGHLSSPSLPNRAAVSYFMISLSAYIIMTMEILFTAEPCCTLS